MTKRRGSFDFIGNVTTVDVPLDLYRDFIPQATIIPCPIHSFDATDADLKITRQIRREAQKCVVEIQAQRRSSGITLSLFLSQLTSILASWRLLMENHSCLLRNAQGKRAEIKVTRALNASLAAIQGALCQRLLMFEEMAATDSGLVSIAEASSDYVDDRIRHQFKPGSKAEAVYDLVEAQVRKRKQVVIFVRYQSAAEGVAQGLTGRGIKAAYLHSGNRNTSDVLEQFNDHRLSVLVVTRQLFGRGFDLPKADSAIFFSPKSDERTMWQEALRIRSCVRDTKDVFVLYYAWTTESEKWARLRSTISPPGSPPGQPFLWTYGGAPPSSPGTPGSGAPGTPYQTKGGSWRWTKEAPPASQSAAEEPSLSEHGLDTFVRRLWDLVQGINGNGPNVSEVNSLIECLENVSATLTERLAGDLNGSLNNLRTKVREGANIFKVLAKCLHPDILGAEAHELFLALEREKERRDLSTH